VDATAEAAVAGAQNGSWYLLSGNVVIGSGVTRLETIHKIRVVGGQIWIFANNMVEILGVSRLIQLSTGKALV